MAPLLHALLLPFPAQGHINPMLSLASNLVSRGYFVTFVDTQRSHSNVLLASQGDLKLTIDAKDPSSEKRPAVPGFRYLTVSDGLPDSFKLHVSESSFGQLLDGIQRQRGVLEEYIDGSKSGDNPVSCVIVDALLSWGQDLAASFGLPGVVCQTSSATNLHLASLRYSGNWTREAVERDQVAELHNVCVSKKEILALLDAPEHSSNGRVQKYFAESFRKASQILVNSFSELEAFLNLPESLASKTRFIGPLMPAGFLEAKARSAFDVQKSVFPKNSEYSGWLDEQEENSVLFISVGSVADLPRAQVENIAAAIEDSGLKFLWVARPNHEGKTYLPEGFEARTKGQGRFTSWADQLDVLNHPATGGFLTHCGWNSTLESVTMGVPMLCLPIFAEQPMNRDLIVKQWKVGMDLRNSKGEVTREHVKEVAVELMDKVKSKAMRERVNGLKEAARRAMGYGGSSVLALTAFTEFVQRRP